MLLRAFFKILQLIDPALWEEPLVLASLSRQVALSLSAAQVRC